MSVDFGVPRGCDSVDLVTTFFLHTSKNLEGNRVTLHIRNFSGPSAYGMRSTSR
jgi:hypothetical protein